MFRLCSFCLAEVKLARVATLSKLKPTDHWPLLSIGLDCGDVVVDMAALLVESEV